MGPLLACLGGFALGRRLSVMVLVPATLAAAAVFLAANLLSGRGLLSDVGQLAILVVSMQAGYFLGLTSRDVLSGGYIVLFRAKQKRSEKPTAGLANHGTLPAGARHVRDVMR